jgi:hypothetical protein
MAAVGNGIPTSYCVCVCHIGPNCIPFTSMRWLFCFEEQGQFMLSRYFKPQQAELHAG